MLPRQILAFILVLIAGCATTEPIIGRPPPVKTFAIRDDLPLDPAAMQRLAEAKLEYASLSAQPYEIASGQTYRIGSRLKADIERNVPTAEWVLKSNFLTHFFPTGPGPSYDFRQQLRASAIRTLVESGQFEYSPQYWENLYGTNDGKWFQVEYALAMSTYIAEHALNTDVGGSNQYDVASYWLSGCNTDKYAVGHRQDDDLLTDLLGQTGCHPRDDLVMRYFGYFMANSAVSVNEKTAFAYKRGSKLFGQKQFAQAAGWYAVVVTLDALGTRPLGDTDAMDYFRSYWHPGMSINDVLTTYFSPQTNVGAYRDSVEAKAKLKLISDAGITQIPSI